MDKYGYLEDQGVTIAGDAKQYLELRKLILDAGLLKRQRSFYLVFSVVIISATIAAIALLPLVINNLPLLLLNIAFISTLFVQIAGLGHDAGHNSIAIGKQTNYYLCVLFLGVGLGVLPSWWINKHNQHHAHPNEEDMDPDIDFPIVAFSHRDVMAKQGFTKFFVKHQVFTYFLITPIITLNMKMHSLRVLFQNKDVKHRILETIAMMSHYWILFGAIVLGVGFIPATAIYVLISMLAGIQLAMVFAPNHKGMPMINSTNKPGFLRLQVLTARNIRPNPLTDYIYIGLNYQIEHHLFPNMPRTSLRQAHDITRNFCEQNSIDYHETSIVGSVKEFTKYMHKISAPLRQPQSDINYSK